MRRWLPLLIILASVILSITVFNRLPETMAIHWGTTGEPDGFGSRVFGAFFLPGLMLFVWGLLTLLPNIDPRRANIEKFRESYDLLIIAVITVLAVLHVGVLGSALGWPVSVGRLAPISIGLLFVVLGNLLPRFRSNFFFGIRTPWTLSSENVWMKTHRLGGYVMVGIGLLMILAGVLNSAMAFYVAIGGGLAMVLTVLVYSWWLWKLEKAGG